MGILQEDVVGDIGAVPTCERCGSERVTRDAFAFWDPETGLWELESVFDPEYCHACEGKTTFVWKRKDTLARTRPRELNDRFRTEGHGNGSIVVTAGVQEKGEAFLRRVFAAVRAFDAFTDDNDPWGEHDFGAIDIDGQKVFWKIDLYKENSVNQEMGFQGETRVLTIMLAHEY